MRRRAFSPNPLHQMTSTSPMRASLSSGSISESPEVVSLGVSGGVVVETPAESAASFLASPSVERNCVAVGGCAAALLVFLTPVG